MLFKRIIYSAIVVGIAAGLLLSVLQITSVDPIIFASESYEVAAPEGAAPAGHEGHDHDHAGWGPEDGAERTFYTVLSNMSAGIGFAAILLALMSQFWLPRQQAIKPWQSLVWGAAGFLVVFVAPGVGLPPEIPGINAAPLEHRQMWWALTVVTVGIGIGLIGLAPLKWKALGLPFVAIPYIVGAPHPEGPEFTHPDPAAVEALVDLHSRFILASGITNLLFWIALGLACGFVFNRWFRAAAPGDEQPA